MHRLGCVASCAAALVLGSASATLTGWAVASPEPLAVAVKSGTTRQDLFPRPAGLEERVAFWKLVFTRYEDTDLIIHDSMHVEKVYAVLDLSGASPKRVATVTAAEKQRIRAVLLELDAREDNLAPEGLEETERAIFELFRDVDEPRKFRAAAERIRGQAGLRKQFAEGVRSSRRYLPEMEEIFRRAGLPAELTRLPLIESCFNLRAYSWRGAAGVWQFMPRTGRLHGLQIDRLVDERRDPLRAAEAAARYLASAYADLGAWPLAITAYNHGSAGIARGVRTVGTTDIVEVVERYNGRTFGFAGQNFYAEFLAALDVDREPERFFGALAYDAPMASEDVLLQHAVGIGQVAESVGLTREALADYNPALSPRVVKGDAAVPRGYRMRVPAGRGEIVEVAVVALAAQRPQRMVQGEVHRVRRGETLSHIARTHGMPVGDLMAHNGIDDARQLRVGQLLRLPGSGSGLEIVPTRVSQDRLAAVRHRVRRGETLQVIARRYGTTVAALKQENGIRDARRIRENQVIRVPGRKKAVAERVEVAATTVTVGHGEHLVRRGETLDRIASAYGTTAAALRQENGIGDPRRIKAGQVIRVPRPGLGQVDPAPAGEQVDGGAAHRAAAKNEEAGGQEPRTVDAGSVKEDERLEELPQEGAQPEGTRAEDAQPDGTVPEEVRAEREPQPEGAQPEPEGIRTEDAQREDAHPEEAHAEEEPQQGGARPEESVRPERESGSMEEIAPGQPQQEGVQPAEVRHDEVPDGGVQSSPGDVSDPAEPADGKDEPARRRPGGRRHRARRGQDLTSVVRRYGADVRAFGAVASPRG